LSFAKQQALLTAPQQLPAKLDQAPSFDTGQSQSSVGVATTTKRWPEEKSLTVETLTMPFEMLLFVPGKGVVKTGAPQVEVSEAQLK
jgi:hypothetical protein